MASAPTIAQTGTVFPDQDFLGAVMLDYRCLNDHTVNDGSSYKRIAFIRGDEQGFEVNDVSGFDGQLFNVDQFARFGAILASASANNSIHGIKVLQSSLFTASNNSERSQRGKLVIDAGGHYTGREGTRQWHITRGSRSTYQIRKQMCLPLNISRGACFDVLVKLEAQGRPRIINGDGAYGFEARFEHSIPANIAGNVGLDL